MLTDHENQNTGELDCRRLSCKHWQRCSSANPICNVKSNESFQQVHSEVQTSNCQFRGSDSRNAGPLPRLGRQVTDGCATRCWMCRWRPRRWATPPPVSTARLPGTSPGGHPACRHRCGGNGCWPLWLHAFMTGSEAGPAYGRNAIRSLLLGTHAELPRCLHPALSCRGPSGAKHH